MAKALSLDLRVRVLAAVSGGMSHREAAQVFAVSPASVSRWRKLSRERGDCQEFRARACIVVSMESPYGTTERAFNPGRDIGPVAGGCRRQIGI
ncbi:helix-turn-helix domain-containing protein [Azorhizobium doebereinerae]|uniref:helix-turn-helix domain-containing protein n=1 Tax=Azorhizobium doebereinerae TaxID=281091 RepID=UPI000A07509A|nr:helix-turn-helix domain-containing protein [Azorhizobium doebereinerae]